MDLDLGLSLADLRRGTAISEFNRKAAQKRDFRARLCKSATATQPSANAGPPVRNRPATIDFLIPLAICEDDKLRRDSATSKPDFGAFITEGLDMAFRKTDGW